MSASKIKLSYSALFFGQSFWEKVLYTPTVNKKAGYWLSKLKRKMEAAHREIYPELVSFAAALADKAGERDEAGKVKDYKGKALPAWDPDKRSLYEKMFAEFSDKQVDIDLEPLALELFDHIQFTPVEWEALQQVALVDPKALEPAAPGPQLVR